MRRVPIGLVGFRVVVVAFVLVLLAAELIVSSGSARAAIGDITEYPIPTAGSLPVNIVAGPDGNLWFTESGAGIVAKVTTAGAFTEYHVPTASSAPFGIAAGPDGNLWFTESGASMVAKVTTSGGFTEYPILTASSGPNGIVAGPDGNLWFTEQSTNKVGKVTPSGAFTEYPVPTLNSNPTSIAAGPDGNLWFTESFASTVAKVTTSGVVTEYHVPSGPTRIAAGPDGNLWFTEFTANKVARITTSGTVTEYMTPGAGSSGPNGIAAGPDGNVWFTEASGNKVGSVTPSGVFKEYSIFTPSTNPAGIATGPDGNVWFTEQNGNQVAKVVASTPEVVPSATYNPIAPLRVLDTRADNATLSDGGSLNLRLGGSTVPATATAVVANVTVTNTSSAGFLTVYPTGASLPLASNLNWTAGETVPNLVQVALGSNGEITIYNSAGSTDVVVDLQGYFAPSNGSTAGEFVSLPPGRITDTRAGSGWPNAGLTLGEGASLDVQVTGFFGNVPASGVEAVVLNATVTNTTADGFLTAYPKGSSLPLASNLNWVPDQTVPNRLVVPVGSGGMVTFYNLAGSTDLVLDVNGYFTDSTASGASFAPLTPSRILDTRDGNGGFNSPVPAGTAISVVVAGQGGMPVMSAPRPPRAVVLNVTATNPSAAGFLTVFPDITPIPEASDLNFVAGQTVPNLVVVKIGTDGRVDVYNAWGSTDVVFDLVGWYG